MEIIGYIAAVLIGITLGLIGGGGSILTVPLLVYLLKIDPENATGYSLFIVGISSLVAVIPKYRKKLIDNRTAIVFGIPAVLAVFATRKYIVPTIPTEIFTLSGFVITKAMLMMLIFAALMLFASFSLIRTKQESSEASSNTLTRQYLFLILQGIFIGGITSFVGAGGGFLIVPALVFFSKLDMKKAIGTSLLIIAVNSIIGFLGYLSAINSHGLQSMTEINWNLLLIFTLLSITGTFIGHALSKKIESHHLKKGFGWFVLTMGIYIIGKELGLFSLIISIF